MKKTVAFQTLGCRLNIAESGSIAEEFIKRGHSIVEFGEEADITFLNTCTVTDKADSSCRNLIRKAKRISPEGKIVVAGCYAQMSPQEIAKMDVDFILGTSEKYKIFDYLENEEEQTIRIDRSNTFWGAATTVADGNHTRAFLKIQDGCNYVCSYCIIPFARGRSKALAVEQVLLDAKKLIEQGFKEIVLTGVNIGEYEQQSGEKLSHLLQQLLKIQGLERLRLSSIEPNTITEELLNILKDSPHFMPHFHLPLQSGDDEILRAMKRKYDLSFYEKTIEQVTRFFPHCGIGADVIAGFPGESHQHFEHTVSFIKNNPITHIHAFPFSKRQGTVAAKMEGQIPFSVKKERVAQLNFLREEKLDQFSKMLVGKTYPILFESQNQEGDYEGYTPHFVKVVASGSQLRNQILPVHITDYQKKTLLGAIVINKN